MRKLQAFNKSGNSIKDVTAIVHLSPKYFWGSLLGENKEDPLDDFHGEMRNNIFFLDIESSEVIALNPESIFDEYREQIIVLNPQEQFVLMDENHKHIIFESKNLLSDENLTKAWGLFAIKSGLKNDEIIDVDNNTSIN